MIFLYWAMHTALSLWIMACLYIAAGLFHFIRPGFYLRIMPPYLPYPRLLVWISGVFEVVLGTGLIFSSTRILSAWGIMLMLLAFLPVHVYMIRSDRFKKLPAWALWGRLLLQPVLIYWAFQFT